MADSSTLRNISDIETTVPSLDTVMDADLTDLAALTGLSLRATCLIGVSRSNGSWETVSFGLSGDLRADYSGLFHHLADSPGPVEIGDVAAWTSAPGAWAPPAGANWIYGSAVRDDSGAVAAAVVVIDRAVRRASGSDAHAIAIAARRVKATLTMGTTRPYPEPVWTEAPAPGVRAVKAPIPAYQPPALAAPAASPRFEADSPLLRTREVAKMFNVTERTILNWVTAGRLPTIRTVGGHLRFRQEDLNALLGVESVYS